MVQSDKIVILPCLPCKPKIRKILIEYETSAQPNPTQPKQTIEAVAFLKIVLAVIKSKKLSRNTKKPSEFHLIYRLLPAFTDSRRIYAVVCMRMVTARFKL